MRALLRPLREGPRAETLNVRLLSRTGRDRITVEVGPRNIYAVDRFRLFDPAQSARRISEQEFATLPWSGKGPDPLKAVASDAVTS